LYWALVWPALAAVVSGASASVRVRFEVNGASGSLVCGSNARLIPNETNFGTSSAQRFRGTNGWAEVTLNQGGPPKLKVGIDRARHRGKPDDVDAQVGYYRDPFWGLELSTVSALIRCVCAGQYVLAIDAT